MPTADPFLDEIMKGWIFNTAKKNYWRIAGFELEDLVQEGYASYYKCWRRYRSLTLRRCPTKDDRKHFMALVQRTFNNRICDLAMKQSAWQEQSMSDLVGESENAQTTWEQILPSQEEEATAAVLLQSAPKEIKQLFQLLIDDALQLTGYRRFGKKKRSPRETTNQYYCRLLGLASNYDVAGRVHEHFFGDGTPLRK